MSDKPVYQPSAMARTHADTLNTSACRQIQEFCARVVNRADRELTPNEDSAFRKVANGLDAILAMQTPKEPSSRLTCAVNSVVYEAAESLVMDGGINPASPEDVAQFASERSVRDFLPTLLRPEWDELSREQQDKIVRQAAGDKEWVA